MKVKEIMTTPVIVGKEENTLEEIAHMIIDNKIGCVPIVGKDGKIVGIITETDFMVKERCVPFSRFNAPQLFGEWMPEEGVEQAYKNARELMAKDIMSESVVSVTEAHPRPLPHQARPPGHEARQRPLGEILKGTLTFGR